MGDSMSTGRGRLLHSGLILGGSDTAAGPILIFFPASSAHLLNAAVPRGIFYLWLFDVLATFMGVLNLLAATDPKRYYGNLVIVALMRLSTAVLAVYSIYGGHAPAHCTGFAVADAALGSLFSAYAITGAPTRGSG
jgi:hypothetical protein